MKKGFKDLTEQRFGRLTVIKIDHRSKKDFYWLCCCDCGREKIILGASLKSGTTKSCGCLNDEKRREYEDLTGQKFNRLLVLEVSHKDKKSNYYWKCLCECGENVIVQGNHLKSGNVKSCGCLQLDKLKTYNTGENHFNWKGGVSKIKDKYPVEFNESLKSQIRQRDGYYCQYPDCDYCDISGNFRKLSVHHINSIKSDCRPENLISLCNKHHARVERNPESWMDYFYQKTFDYRFGE